jgi:GNAT superfamily N-acetyltransferase
MSGMRAPASVGMWPEAGLERRLRNLVHSILGKIVRFQSRYVWERALGADCQPPEWPSGETVEAIGPETAGLARQAPLFDFLGGPALVQELEGVSRGDRLFAVRNEFGYAAYSFIFFDITSSTMRQKRILLVEPGTPVIGLSFTAPEARGKGIYKRLLQEMFAYLAGRGAGRVVCEVEPGNGPSNAASRAVGMCLRRELSDCIIARKLVIQRVREAGKARWRILLV